MRDSSDYLYRLHRLIYFSRATPECIGRMTIEFPHIVQTSQRQNAASGVTSALLECNGWFVQALEGPRIDVMTTYDRIGADSRHRDITLINAGPAETRRFAGWNMCGRCLSPTDHAIVKLLERDGNFNPKVLTPGKALDLLTTVRDIQTKNAPKGGPPAASKIVELE